MQQGKAGWNHYIISCSFLSLSAFLEGMAIPKNGLTIFALLVTLILETQNFIEFSSPAIPVGPLCLQY